VSGPPSADTFPPGFVWGVAGSAYQVEGAVTEDGRTASIWDTFSHTPGATASGATGDVATDHYHRHAEDVALMAGLGVGAHRLSLAWPRIQPGGHGGVAQRGLDFYRRLLGDLRERGIETWVTLYHWDLPQELEDAGGWPARDTAARFAEYAQHTAAALGDLVTTWTTVNEPWCAAFLGYASGVHAPGRQEPEAAVRAAHHLLLGHGLATQALRAAAPAGTPVGIALNVQPVEPATAAAADADVARRMDGLANRLFLDALLAGSLPGDVVDDLSALTGWAHIRDGDAERIAAPLDFLGVNYYTRCAVRAGGNPGPPSPWVGCGPVEVVRRGLPVTGMGWEVDPDGLVAALEAVQAYDPPPLVITENGAAFDDPEPTDGRVHDPERVAYLDAHVRAAREAIRRGVDLRGYFAWTLMDNFEWDNGYERAFGLVHVDRDTLTRTPKDSATWFREVVARNGVPAGAGVLTP
jgi:beta-glucosidase